MCSRTGPCCLARYIARKTTPQHSTPHATPLRIPFCLSVIVRVKTTPRRASYQGLPRVTDVQREDNSQHTVIARLPSVTT